jgi:MATE family, multidrug efflux pump
MKDLSKGSIGRHVIEMAGYLAIGMLVQTAYFLVDLYFVSGLGKEAVAGVSQGATPFFIVLALTQVLQVSTVTLISHAVGRKDQAEASHVFNQSLALSAVSGVVFLALAYVLGGPYVDSVSADAATAAAGRTYLYGYLPALGLQFAMVGLGAALRGTGIVKPTMAVQSLTLLLNIVLAPVLIAGWGTGHPLGVMGAALASSIAIAVGVILLSLYFVRLEKYVSFDPAQWRPHWPTWARMLNIGAPAGGEFGLMFVIISVIYVAIRQFGSDAQAGVAIGIRCMQSIFLPAMAVAFAVAPIAGQNFGAKLAARVRGTFNTAAVLGSVIMAGITLVCQLWPDQLIRIFAKDPKVIEVGATYLRITSWNFVANGIIFTCSGMFQGLGNTWPSLFSSAMRIFTYVVPALWMAQQPWVRIEDFWYLSVATIAVQAVVSYLLLRREMRRRLDFAVPATVPVAAV